MISRHALHRFASLLLTTLAFCGTAPAAENAAPSAASASSAPHTIGLAKLIVGDLEKTQAFCDRCWTA